MRTGFLEIDKQEVPDTEAAGTDDSSEQNDEREDDSRAAAGTNKRI